MSDSPATACEPDEIEVTPEMIKAGAEVLSMYHPAEDAAIEWVAEIYLAMAAARAIGLKCRA